MIKKKFLLGTFLSAISISAYTDNYGPGAITAAPSGEDPGLQSFIDEHNLPQPGSGIQIVPYTASSMARLKSFEKAIDQDGSDYVQQKSDDAISLLRLGENKYFPGTKKTYESSDPMDSHIKASLSLIKLSFPFQKYLASNPLAGDVIQSTGGLRKIRWAAGGKGKRGGVRIIYYHVTPDSQIRLLLIYKKGIQDDLTAEQKKILRHINERW